MTYFVLNGYKTTTLSISQSICHLLDYSLTKFQFLYCCFPFCGPLQALCFRLVCLSVCACMQVTLPVCIWSCQWRHFLTGLLSNSLLCITGSQSFHFLVSALLLLIYTVHWKHKKCAYGYFTLATEVRELGHNQGRASLKTRTT